MRSATDTETLTVSAYATQIARAVRNVGAATIEGEVQKPQQSRKGLLYFDLTDGDSTLSCKVFGRQIPRLRHVPGEGDLVRVRIERPDFWTTAGRLSLIVADIELAGVGELLRRRRELLERLRAEGLCDPERRKPLPAFPRAVGVIAGTGSDGMEDVIRAIHDRLPHAHVVACPALVQGKAAPRDVVDALATLQQHPQVDVIVIARGGGSVQDLIAFDDERLCRAVFACATPVVAAIGHTNNVPVCNHVTHAASTPSRSAELVVPSLAELVAGLQAAGEALARLPARMEERTELLEMLADRLSASAAFDARTGDIRELGRRLEDGIARQRSDHERDYGHAVQRLLADLRETALRRPGEGEERLAQLGRLAGERVAHRLRDDEQSLARLSTRIEARDFRRHGFVLVTDEAGRPQPSIAGVRAGTRLNLSFRDGQARVAVEETKEEEQ